MIKGGFCLIGLAPINPEVIMFANDPLLPVDLVKLHGITHGDTGMIREIAEDYFLQADEILGMILDAAENREADVIKRLVHKLKGSTVTLGIHQVRDLLQKMDEAVEEEHFQRINPLIDDARNSLNKTREFIQTYLTH